MSWKKKQVTKKIPSAPTPDEVPTTSAPRHQPANSPGTGTTADAYIDPAPMPEVPPPHTRPSRRKLQAASVTVQVPPPKPRRKAASTTKTNPTMPTSVPTKPLRTNTKAGTKKRQQSQEAEGSSRPPEPSRQLDPVTEDVEDHQGSREVSPQTRPTARPQRSNQQPAFMKQQQLLSAADGLDDEEEEEEDNGDDGENSFLPEDGETPLLGGPVPYESEFEEDEPANGGRHSSAPAVFSSPAPSRKRPRSPETTENRGTASKVRNKGNLPATARLNHPAAASQPVMPVLPPMPAITRTVAATTISRAPSVGAIAAPTRGATAARTVASTIISRAPSVGAIAAIPRPKPASVTPTPRSHVPIDLGPLEMPDIEDLVADTPNKEEYKALYGDPGSQKPPTKMLFYKPEIRPFLKSLKWQYQLSMWSTDMFPDEETRYSFFIQAWVWTEADFDRRQLVVPFPTVNVFIQTLCAAVGSEFRGTIKTSASQRVMDAYNLRAPAGTANSGAFTVGLVGTLLHGHAFICAEDWICEGMGKPASNVKYTHPIIRGVISDVFFKKGMSLAEKALLLPEVAMPIIAIVCVAIRNSLEEYLQDGTRTVVPMEEKKYKQFYEDYIEGAELSRIAKPNRWARIMHELTSHCSAGIVSSAAVRSQTADPVYQEESDEDVAPLDV